MRKLIYIAIAAVASDRVLRDWRSPPTGLRMAAILQRTGWQKDEKILTKDNVKNLKLLWKLKTDNVTRALFSFTPALILQNVRSGGATKEMVYVVGLPTICTRLKRTPEDCMAETFHL